MNDRTPDLKAPRFRKDIYNSLSKERTSSLSKSLLNSKYTSREIKSIIKEYNKTVWENIIENRDGVALPEQLGSFFIGTCPPKKKHKNVDFKKTSIYDKIIQHRNWESDNYLAKIFYTTFGLKISYRNNEVWAFKAVRNFSRSVAKNYPSKWSVYHRIDPLKQISIQFRENKDNIIKKERTKSLLAIYNEFEF